MTTTAFRPYKVTAAYRVHRARSATWAEIGPWRVADSFGDATREASCTRQAVGLQDVSPIGKLDLKGAGTGGVLARVNDGTITATLSIKPGHALLLTEPGREAGAHETLLGMAGTPAGCVHITDVTSALSAYCLVGPLAVDVLNRLTSLDVRRDRFAQHCCAPCSLGHVHATVYRDDWGALPAYLVLVGRDVGEYVWTAMEAAGSALGLTPFGMAAERLLRAVDPRLSPVS
ncbi:MAG: hypothetical protein WD733_24130 [Bryobacterales bacterium]